MESSGRVFIPIAFLTGLMLAAFLYLASSNITFSVPVQAAAPADMNDDVVNEGESQAKVDVASQQASSEGSGCQISEEFPAKVRRWCDLITEHATKRGLEPDLLAALILQESGGNPDAYSRSGAVGLMQVMPRNGLAASFMCVNGPCFQNRPTIAELEDPEFNIAYGSKMLAGLEKKYGNLRDALKYYGPADVGYYYSDIVLSLYKQYRQ